MEKPSVWVVEGLVKDDEGERWVPVGVTLDQHHAHDMWERWVSSYPHRVREYIRKED